ncbi:nucleotide pyrophosphohydrolase [Endozoicomonas sp. OPT23]|uniref:MazG nucleotide pyrophosphohydrolase domain-containing protein n=1 Tax=Endozoicomonas sp. OPT23 TaxID=2072845 RepID=UPI00129BC8E1|nr:MazG nucleotide pyrophosphohydrolase domain-containing protein [Endozoicomonas sp. OPT23]MRI34607.1 nucleotide pyrophosphohydrolase [Endozoicomonas sp. OPT23]
MNKERFDALLATVNIKNQIDLGSDWSNGSETYFSELKSELDEVAEELESGRRCYLEDELGDVLWDYLNLLTSLEQEGRISIESVLERADRKYHERISGIQQGKSWKQVKEQQKGKLAKEFAETD